MEAVSWSTDTSRALAFDFAAPSSPRTVSSCVFAASLSPTTCKSTHGSFGSRTIFQHSIFSYFLNPHNNNDGTLFFFLSFFWAPGETREHAASILRSTHRIPSDRIDCPRACRSRRATLTHLRMFGGERGVSLFHLLHEMLGVELVGISLCLDGGEL